MINAGKYRHKITIRKASTDGTRNAYGERTAAGVVLAAVWAEKQDWSGREMIEAGRETPMMYTRFFIRYRSDVLPDMTVEFGSEVYRVESIMDKDGRKEELVLMCKRNEAE